MRRDDEVRLRHMLDAAREALSFVQGRDRSELDTNRQLVLSLVKDFEIVGEAAAQISEATRARTPEIPWQEIVSTRNRLVHGYFSINLDIVWQTTQEDLPSLIALLERLVSDESIED